MANEAKHPEGKEPVRTGETGVVESRPQEAASRRLPYSPPRLIPIGKVADLVFGGGKTTGDGAHTKAKN
jgi:hypothetical protein